MFHSPLRAFSARALASASVFAALVSSCDGARSTVAPGGSAAVTGPAVANASGTYEVSDGNFDAEVVKATTPVLVDFWAPWCGPCRALAPTIDSLAQTYKGKVKVCKVNVDNSPRTAQAHGIRGIPHVALFVNGKVVQNIVGLSDKSDYTRAIDAHLPASP